MNSKKVIFDRKCAIVNLLISCTSASKLPENPSLLTLIWPYSLTTSHFLYIANATSNYDCFQSRIKTYAL